MVIFTMAVVGLIVVVSLAVATAGHASDGINAQPSRGDIPDYRI